METQTIAIIQNKVSKVRKSCVTPEQRIAFKRYRELYNETLKRYENDFRYRMKVDMIILLSTSFGLAAVVGTIAFGLMLRAFSH